MLAKSYKKSQQNLKLINNFSVHDKNMFDNGEELRTPEKTIYIPKRKRKINVKEYKLLNDQKILYVENNIALIFLNYV